MNNSKMASQNQIHFYLYIYSHTHTKWKVFLRRIRCWFFFFCSGLISIQRVCGVNLYQPLLRLHQIRLLAFFVLRCGGGGGCDEESRMLHEWMTQSVNRKSNQIKKKQNVDWIDEVKEPIEQTYDDETNTHKMKRKLFEKKNFFCPYWKAMNRKSHRFLLTLTWKYARP